MPATISRVALPYRVVDGQVIVPRPNDGMIVTLGGAAATVWRLLDTPATRAELTARVAEALAGDPHAAPPDDVARELDEALRLLLGEGLVER